MSDCRSRPASSLNIQHRRCSLRPPSQSIPVLGAGHPVCVPVGGFTSECSDFPPLPLFFSLPSGLFLLAPLLQLSLQRR